MGENQSSRGSLGDLVRLVLQILDLGLKVVVQLLVSLTKVILRERVHFV